jgi:hypothetical protein
MGRQCLPDAANIKVPFALYNGFLPQGSNFTDTSPTKYILNVLPHGSNFTTHVHHVSTLVKTKQD